MSKINGKITGFIVFLILVVLWGLFTSAPADTKTSIDDELKVAGMKIRFEDGTTEPEVKAILENYNMTMNYNIDYNVDSVVNKYYIMLGKDNWNIRRELNKGMKEEKKDWIESSPAQVIRKGDDYILTVSEQAAHDENFLAILDKYDIPVKKFVWCYIRFEKPDGSKYWIPEEDAITIKNELERNESIFTVSIDYIYDQ
ncbi:hypothetical protein MSHOH_1611 [Methanosarcina horonobensis HB-1 = JCM 15518]|uniref:Uncharacterized protein n=1 Tax=Methanosarcina horonobensis HB-1 = JCM 15518 TaxID=1434110 RepID=A0A0E3S965_9EURY|nr:UPF0228 family protein [Methanosarcina horonobensis]AKB78094.1 hypothetical protein MSHOH_1611 [Methanosarcina horonobensis HB-1 = JCM 15518]